MDIDFSIRKYIKCSKRQKRKCLNTVQSIIELSNLARKEGILAIEEAARMMDDEFTKLLTMLVVDGTDPCLVKEIAVNHMIACNKKGYKLLQKIIITRGILGIQAGENPRIIEEILLSYLGKVDNKKTFNILEFFKQFFSSREEIDEEQEDWIKNLTN